MEEHPILQQQQHMNGGAKTNIIHELGNDIDKAMETDVLLKEDLVLRYLELVIPEDKYLINLPYIHETGEKYIENWISGIYVDFVKSFQALVSKYASRKKYFVRSSKTAITVFKSETSASASASASATTKDNTDKHKVIEKIDKPIFMELKTVMHKGKEALQTQRAATKMQYEHLLTKPYLDEKDKNKFNKQREQFISTLNAFYAVQYYSNKINNQISTNVNVAIPIVVDDQKHLKHKPMPRINSVYINVGPTFIDNLFQQEGDKLELYNRIIEMQATMGLTQNLNLDLDTQTHDKTHDTDMAELQSLIKSYILYDTQNDIMKDLNKELKKLKEYKPIHWLVVPNSNDRPEFCKKSISFLFQNSPKSNNLSSHKK